MESKRSECSTKQVTKLWYYDLDTWGIFTLSISSQAILLGPCSLGNRRKLIKCQHSFKAKFDPVSWTIPFQESLVSWVNTPSFISAKSSSPTKSVSLWPACCGAAQGSYPGWRSELGFCCYISVLFQREIMSLLNHSVLFLPVYFSPPFPSSWGPVSKKPLCSEWLSLASGRVKVTGTGRRTFPQDRNWAYKIIFLLHNSILHAISFILFLCILSLKNSSHLWEIVKSEGPGKNSWMKKGKKYYPTLNIHT